MGRDKKEYIYARTNPSFFWLYMTAIIGKIKEPSKCYVPYFFDFVGHKGLEKLYCIKDGRLLCERSNDEGKS